MIRRHVISALILAAGVGVSTAPAAATHPAPLTAHAACRSATIGGHHKCIARGQYCSRSHQRDYRRYGFSCSKRDRRGRYHLT